MPRSADLSRVALESLPRFDVSEIVRYVDVSFGAELQPIYPALAGYQSLQYLTYTRSLTRRFQESKIVEIFKTRERSFLDVFHQRKQCFE